MIDMIAFEDQIPPSLQITYSTPYGPMHLQRVRMDGMGIFVSMEKGAMEMYAPVNTMNGVTVELAGR